MRKTIEERVARLEAVCNSLRSEMDDVLKNAYEQAVSDKNEEMAAELARKIRNKLLADSDKECTLDKVLTSAPSGTTFSDWIPWLEDLASVSNNAWGTYRQALRDLPQQGGFPFNIEFPKPPNYTNEESEEDDE